MRIQSKFQDFYDWALGTTGIDEALFWDRIPEDFYFKESVLTVDRFSRDFNDILRRSGMNSHVQHVEAKPETSAKISFDKGFEVFKVIPSPLVNNMSTVASKLAAKKGARAKRYNFNWEYEMFDVTPEGFTASSHSCLQLDVVQVSILAVPCYCLRGDDKVYLRIKEIIIPYDRFKAEFTESVGRKEYERAIESATLKSQLVGDKFDRGELLSFASPDKSLMTMHEILGTPVFAASRPGFIKRTYRHADGHTLIKTNPNLGAMGLGSVIEDHLDLFQRLCQFVALNNNPETVEITSDKTKRDKAGFHNMSFKKRPE